MKNKILLTLFAFAVVMCNTLKAEDYSLKVGGTQVTSDNANNILGDNKVMYDNNTNTLTLNNAEITTTGTTIGIQNIGINDLKIVLQGNSTITSNDADGISLNHSTTFKGQGSITVTSENKTCILLGGNNTTMTVIDGCKLYLEGSKGISGVTGSNGELIQMVHIDNSTIKAKGIDGSIVNLRAFNRIGSAIVQPAGAFFNPALGSIIWAETGLIVKEQVIVDVSYEIQVGQTWITQSNKDDVLEDGKVSYNPTMKTLTLNGATINTPQKTYGILNKVTDDLIIKLEGTNVISGYDYATLSLRKNTTITGSGSLKVESNKGAAVYIDDNTTLTIKDCSVEAIGAYGFSGDEGTDGETLKIINSTVKATGANKGSVADLNNLILQDCSISQPIGAAFNGTTHCVEKDGVLVKAQLIILPSAPSDVDINILKNNINIFGGNGFLYIDILEPTQEKEAVIYSIGGELINKIAIGNKQNIIPMSAGVYIVKIDNNVQKVIVK